MTISVLADFEKQPSAFNWSGPISNEVVDRWTGRQEGLRIPIDLIVLWTEVGGGDVFESETILEPFAAPTADDIDAENERLQSIGLPPGLLAFHIGFCISAFERATGDIVQLDHESFAVRSRFGTFDEWYRLLIRAEYASRYGLA